MKNDKQIFQQALAALECFKGVYANTVIISKAIESIRIRLDELEQDSGTHYSTNLIDAARAVINRWDTPLWKDVPATATYINALRVEINKIERDDKKKDKIARHIVANLLRRKRASRRRIREAERNDAPKWCLDLMESAYTEAHNSAEISRRILYGNEEQ